MIINLSQIEEDLKNEYCFKLSKEEKEIFNPNYYSADQILEMVESNEYTILINFDEKNQEIKGYIILHDSVDVLEIMKIGTSFRFRNSGVAQELICEIKKTSKLNVYLEVRESNLAAREFYKKNSFKEISKRKKYYNDNNEDAIIMLFEREGEI